MVEAVGFKALGVVRRRIGPLTLEGLEGEKWRQLRPGQVSILRRDGVRCTL